MRIFLRTAVTGLTACLLMTGAAWSAEGGKKGGKVNISPNLPSVTIHYQGKNVKIERIQDNDHKLTNSFSKTSRKCPPFCVQPMNVAPGVATVAEMELLDFLVTKARRGDGVLIDARVTSFYKKGTIPGSVNMPFTIFTKDKSDPELGETLKNLGVVDKGIGEFDFTGAKELMLWCNGPWCGQSPRAIKGLLSLGYPAEKLFYYRGGMQMWQVLGMKTVAGK